MARPCFPAAHPSAAFGGVGVGNREGTGWSFDMMVAAFLPFVLHIAVPFHVSSSIWFRGLKTYIPNHNCRVPASKPR